MSETPVSHDYPFVEPGELARLATDLDRVAEAVADTGAAFAAGRDLAGAAFEGVCGDDFRAACGLQAEASAGLRPAAAGLAAALGRFADDLAAYRSRLGVLRAAGAEGRLEVGGGNVWPPAEERRADDGPELAARWQVFDQCRALKQLAMAELDRAEADLRAALRVALAGPVAAAEPAPARRRRPGGTRVDLPFDRAAATPAPPVTHPAQPQPSTPPATPAGAEPAGSTTAGSTTAGSEPGGSTTAGSEPGGSTTGAVHRPEPRWHPDGHPSDGHAGNGHAGNGHRTDGPGRWAGDGPVRAEERAAAGAAQDAAREADRAAAEASARRVALAAAQQASTDAEAALAGLPPDADTGPAADALEEARAAVVEAQRAAAEAAAVAVREAAEAEAAARLAAPPEGPRAGDSAQATRAER